MLIPYWSLENLAHYIFVIKLWILAQKLREIKIGTFDGYLGCKMGTITAIFIIFLVSGTVLMQLMLLNPESK
jgi:hypothetical protein